MTYAELDGVEDALINILHTGQQHYCASDSTLLTLTLVGFDLCAEFRILSHQYPRFLKRFTSWVDIQELVKELTPRNTQAPSLRNTLIGVGYEPKFPTKPSRSDGHSAGNDAARSIAVLVKLLFFSPRGEDITHACRDYHANRTKQRANKRRESVNMNKRDLFSKHYPKPRERYLFQSEWTYREPTSPSGKTQLNCANTFSNTNLWRQVPTARRYFGGGFVCPV